MVLVSLQVLLTLGRRGPMGDGISGVLQSTALLSSSSSVVQVGTLPQILDEWRSVTSNRFV